MATLVNGNGNPAVYAQQDADLYVGVMGTTSCIMSVGSKFAATIETANLISVADGVILTKEGRRIQTDVGEVDEFNIPNGAAGVTRYYIIGYHLYTDGQGSQKCETFVQLMSSATDTIPEAEFRNGATEVYVSLYRVTQVGLTLNDPESLLPDALNIGDINASLTDNGASFRFGCDPISGSYGYYDSENNFKSFGGGGMPALDYANPLFTFNDSETKSYTATGDCWLVGEAYCLKSGSYFGISINGTQIHDGYSTEWVCLKLKSGDTVTGRANHILRIYVEA